jgi:mitochondrial enoyl-[acyl-carrier protein] reductase / trans-2-enoyl-CoA reductase
MFRPFALHQSHCNTTGLSRVTVPGRNGRCMYHEVSFLKTGEPKDVLAYQQKSIASHTNIDDNDDDDQVQVEMMHAPWNPADVNTVQGKYPSLGGLKRTSHHFQGYNVAGSEGWGRIISSSSSLSPYKEGSLVAVGLPGLGTLRSTLWAPRHALLPLGDRGEQLLQHAGASGSTLFQLGGTALRMLTDFVSLSSSGVNGGGTTTASTTTTTTGNHEGHVVLQNAGTSGVGVLVSQLAHVQYNVPVVSMVRRGSKTQKEYEEMVQYLVTVGNNSLIVAEEDFHPLSSNSSENVKTFQTRLRDLSSTHQLPRLALNAVGGGSAKLLLKCLETSGTMVTYGGMSMEPVEVGTPQLIFKNVHLCGYWHGRWMVENVGTTPSQQQDPQQQHEGDARQAMVNDLMTAVLDQNVTCPPVKVFQLSDVHAAMEWHPGNTISRQKLVFDCRETSKG